MTMFRWNEYTQEEKWLYILRWIMGLAALTGCVLLIADYGFYLSQLEREWLRTGFLGIGFLFVAGYILQLVVHQDRWRYLQANKVKYAFTFLILFEIVLVYGFSIDLSEIFRDINLLDFRRPHTLFFQLYILVNIIRWIVKVVQFLAQFNSSPARFILLSFSMAILTGTGLLLLPKSTSISLSPINALFTATSAVCVTGLIVVDTATAFTTTGQLIILGLIQIGGLGIMTVTAFFSVLFGQRMSGREQVLLEDMLNTDRLAKLGSILKMVFLTTIVIEICGVIFLYFSWRGELPPQQCLYFALFHSISAFCNAGFSTFSDSLVGFSASMRINLILCSLIILGGIGFGTLRNLGSFVPRKPQRDTVDTVPHLSVQTKLVLITTACLFLLGFILFFLLEYDHVLRAASLKEKILGAFFQAVTFRTAGFNTVDFSGLRDSTLMLAISLMFIGAAPGSTGGGMKVTTIAILFSTLFALARGRTRVELFRRTIPAMVLYQTIAVITMYFVLALVMCFILALTEPQQRPIELLFETVSALATVGLTTGITPELSTIGRILIIIAMFLGRIGPFTLALAIGQRQQSEHYRYPEERVQIG